MDQDDDELEVQVVVGYFACVLATLPHVLYSNNAIVARSTSFFEQRLKWAVFSERYGQRADFKRHMRMSLLSFTKLLRVIEGKLQVCEPMAMIRGGPIIPELCLYATIRYLAGGSYSDIKFFTGISISSMYRVLWKTIKAIISSGPLQIHFPQTIEAVKAAAQGFCSVSSHSSIWNCVSVVDGYLLATITPSKKEVKNVRSYFSGHYQSYGVNIQAACDSKCRFTFVGVAGPGTMGDREALNEIELGSLIASLPGLYCAIGDCAYTPTEKMIPIYGGAKALIPKYDNFNFYASQCRIRIEMAFGLMVKKWGILQRPASIKMKNVKFMITAICQLHNYCINERLQGDESIDFHPSNTEMSPYVTALRSLAATFDHTEMQGEYETPWSLNRERMVTEIEANGVTRPRRK
jgi:DDE superfamily endonuclease